MRSSQQAKGLPFRPLPSSLPLPTQWGERSPSLSGYEPVFAPSRQMSSDGSTTRSIPSLSAEERSPLTRLHGSLVTSSPSSKYNPSLTHSKVEDLVKSSEDVVKSPDDVEVLEVEDLEEEEDLVGEKAASLEDLDPHLSRLSELFHATAIDDFITMDAIPTLLIRAGVNDTMENMHTAIREVLGADAGPTEQVDFVQLTKIFTLLKVEQEDPTMDAEEIKDIGCIARWVEKMSDKKATNVLLAIVVGVSFIAAFLVAGLAIVFMWTESTSTLGIHMLEDLGTMKDILDVFNTEIYTSEVTQRAREISTLVATVTSYVSYRAVLETDKKNLLYMSAFLGQGVAAWWEYQPENAYINIAKVMAIWADQVMTAEGDEVAFGIVNNIVDLLPNGYEILLGQWTDATNTSVRYINPFRFASQCADGICDANAHGVTFSPMKAAMQGMEGAVRGLDYRPHEVFVGFTSVAGVGVEYKSDIEIIDDSKLERLRSYFDLQNANAVDSREFLLGRLDAKGNVQLLTKLRFCDQSCLKFAIRMDGPLGRALQHQIGVMEGVGYNGQMVIAAHTPIASTNLGLVVQMLRDDRIGGILKSVAAMLDNINTNKLTGTEELELTVVKVVNGTKKLTHLTKYKYEKECPNGVCDSSPEYLQIPMKNCSSGAVRCTDYRGKKVYAGFFCMPEFNAYLSMKVDDTQVNQEMMGYILRFIDERNVLDKGTSYEFMAAQAKAGVIPQDVNKFSDFTLLSQIKNPETCIHPDCSWDSNSILRTLRNKLGDLPALMNDVNYARRSVTAAMEYNPLLGGGCGLVLEMDTQDFMKPVVDTSMILLLFTLGISIFSTAVLVVVTKSMMRSMVTASLEGKRAVEKEKEQFGALVASMYPAYVVPRLLAGERHIVAHIKHTAVFFSDIYEFTSASNTISPEELISFMGYTYGVMDDIAERFGVYKVKTVGDAYLAISGLPGVTGIGTKEPCLDMLRFASCVAQIFSHRFNHPEKGEILNVVAGAMSWNKKKRRVQILSTKAASSEAKSKGSVAPSALTGDAQHGNWTGTEAESNHPGSVVSGGSKTRTVSSVRGFRGIPQVQCIMSYGVATGPVTAGVLQGKSPMFDIWGKTVNLASRMETTGQPGRIQVSEHFFRKVAAVAGQPFAFEHGHKAYCKGFGAVNSYFVRSSSEPPPKDLMIKLGLEPCYGLFYFDNVLTMQRTGPNGSTNTATKVASNASASVHEDVRSVTSSHSSLHANPKVTSIDKCAIDVVEYEDDV